MRAERRLGELIRAQKKTMWLAIGGKPFQPTGANREPVARPTLAEVGIDKKLSRVGLEIGSFPANVVNIWH